MLEHELFFKGVLLQQERTLSFDQLLENNANNDIWGNQFSLMALSILVKRPIYSYSSYKTNCLNTNPFNFNSLPIKIILNNSHYSAVLPINLSNNYGDISHSKNELIIRSLKNLNENAPEIILE